MCTLVIAWRVLADAPVAVAANRDEALDRPSKPPSVVDPDPLVVAPLDERAGGTWIGVNERGLFVGLSNRWTAPDPADEPPGERSRGLLVRDLLGEPTADDAAAAVESAVAARDYAPFNLVVADAADAVAFAWDGRLALEELVPGVHAVLNAGWDDEFAAVPGRDEAVAREVESARRLRERLAVDPDEPADRWLDRAADALADHDVGVCVHRDGYGTRSSSLLALYADGHAAYRFADGPPCETAYADVSVPW